MKRNYLFLLVVLNLACNQIISAQNYQWAKSVGAAGEQSCMDMAVDSQGNLYLIGNISGSNIDFDPGEGIALLSSSGGVDIFFAKYDSLGNYLWAKSIGGTNDDIGARIALDDAGNVYITGWFQSENVDFDPGIGTALISTAGNTDIFLGSYDPDGNYRWAFNIGSSNIEGAHDICTDKSGHIWISGYFGGTDVDFDPGPGEFLMSSIANSGDVFVAGYHADGTFVRAFKASGTGYEVANGITTDKEGNIFIVGLFANTVDFDPGPGLAALASAGEWDIFIAKYDSSGSYLWAKSIGGTLTDNGADVATDQQENCIFIANFNSTGVDFNPGAGTALFSSNGGSDMAVVKLDPDGNYLWAGSFGGPQNDWIIKVKTDASGNIYHTGAFRGTNVDFDPGAGVASLSSAGQEDIFFSEWDANGNLSWAKRIGGSYSDWGNTIGLTGDEDIRIAGNFAGTNIDFDPGAGTALLSSKGGSDIFFGGYSHTITSAEGPGDLRENKQGSLLIFPNPTTGKTTIEFYVASPGTCRILMTDVSGKKILTVLESEKETGKHAIEADFSFLDPGIYLCTLETSSDRNTTRVILSN